MHYRLKVLGSGGSLGVPVPGCGCPVCSSPSPFNKRLRPSVLLQIQDKNFLIDCGPDFRQQMLQHQIMHLDGILFTHAHYDHTAGVDELRAFTFRQKSSLPCLMSHETYGDLHRRFFYIFGEESKKNLYAAELLPILLENDAGELTFEGLRIQYISYYQMKMKIIGFRLGDFAYITDIREYDDSIWPFFKGVKTLILSALRFTVSPVHFNVDEAIEFSRRTGAENTWLTHISHELEHEHVNAYLPKNIRMAYDGLVLEDLNL